MVFPKGAKRSSVPRVQRKGVLCVVYFLVFLARISFNFRPMLGFAHWESTFPESDSHTARACKEGCNYDTNARER